MSGQPPGDRPAAESGLGERRAQVLAALRSCDDPLSAAEVAEATELHLNTARLHLDALVETGLAKRVREPRQKPGRPRVLYSSSGEVPGPRSYRLLAEILTGMVTALGGGNDAAVETGIAWGRHLVQRPRPSRPVEASDAVTEVTSMLEELGFRPEIHAVGGGTDVLLRNCPFREVAEEHSDLVCAVHLGIIRGALEQFGEPVKATALDPFVTPHTCVARLRTPADMPR